MRGFKIMLAVAAAAGGAMPGPAQPVSRIDLAAGEQATLVFDDGGASRLRQGQAEPLNRYDQAALGVLTSGAYDHATGPNAAPIGEDELGVARPPVPPGLIRLRLLRLGKGNSALVVENGYGRAFTYRARIHVAGRAAPTDVCQVLPARRGYELWHEEVERIEISAMRQEPWIEGRPPRCE